MAIPQKAPEKKIITNKVDLSLQVGVINFGKDLNKDSWMAEAKKSYLVKDMGDHAALFPIPK